MQLLHTLVTISYSADISIGITISIKLLVVAFFNLNTDVDINGNHRNAKVYFNTILHINAKAIYKVLI